MGHFSNEEIIDGFRKKDNLIIGQVYKENYFIIERFITKRNGSYNDVQEILQNAIILIYKKVLENDFHLDCAFPTYLFSVCRLLWFKEFSLNKTDELDKIEDEDLVLEEPDNELELLKINLYSHHFEELHESCKKILKLYFEKTDIEDITRIMGFKSKRDTLDRKYKCKKALMYKIISDKEYKKIDNEIYSYNR
jgi:hypothetical protein